MNVERFLLYYTQTMIREGDEHRELEPTLVSDEEIPAINARATQAALTGQASITPYALGAIAVVVAVDYVVSSVGRDFFWSPQLIYLASFFARFISFIILAQLFRRSVRDNAQTLTIVFGWLGVLSGLILACIRFITTTAFWTFLNLIVEPIDSMLLALIASYIVYQLARAPRRSDAQQS